MELFPNFATIDAVDGDMREQVSRLLANLRAYQDYTLGPEPFVAGDVSSDDDMSDAPEPE